MDQHILELVLKHTNDGKDYKAYCLVNKLWYSVISKLFPGGDKFCNHLITLLMKFPNGSLVDSSLVDKSTNEQWNYKLLSLNTSITWKYISENLGKDWDWYALSYNVAVLGNKNITWEDILSSNKPWDYGVLSYSKSLTWEIIKNANKPWNFRKIAANPNITLEIVMNNPDKDWWSGTFISSNPNIFNSLKFNGLPIGKSWDYDRLSLNDAVTWDIIKNHSDKAWNYYNVCKNINITWENIQEVPFQNSIIVFCKYNKNIIDLNLDVIQDYDKLLEYYNIVYDRNVIYHNLSFNLNLTEECIINNIDKPWNYTLLSHRRHISAKLFRLTHDKPWNYEFISDHIEWAIVKEFPDKPWNYCALTFNTNVPVQFIINNPDKPWDYGKLSHKGNLSWRDVVNHPELNWNFQDLSTI